MTTLTPELRPFLLLTWKINKLYRRVFAEAAQTYALSKNEMDILLFLANNSGEYTAADVARYRHISKSLVCKSVNTLMERNYLTAARNPNDRRQAHLAATPEAAEAIAALLQAQSRFSAILEEPFSPRERDAFRQSVEKLSSHLDQYN